MTSISLSSSDSLISITFSSDMAKILIFSHFFLKFFVCLLILPEIPSCWVFDLHGANFFWPFCGVCCYTATYESNKFQVAENSWDHFWLSSIAFQTFDIITKHYILRTFISLKIWPFIRIFFLLLVVQGKTFKEVKVLVHGLTCFLTDWSK